VNYRALIDVAAFDTDNAVAKFLVSVTPGGYKPWRITT
jgi:hypothetical protein